MADQKVLGGKNIERSKPPTEVARAIESLRSPKLRNAGLKFPKNLENAERKIKPYMNEEAALQAMTEGCSDNVRKACRKILEIGERIRPERDSRAGEERPSPGIEALVLLDAAGICGRKLESLYNACGGKNAVGLFALILAVHDRTPIPYGDPLKSRVLGVDDLLNIVKSQQKTTGGLHIADAQDPKDFIELSHVISAVRKHYVYLLRGDSSVPEAAVRTPAQSIKPPEKPGE
ncbi:MAG: hypothetical protein Q7S08_02855 [bacterium]|nr:hypothetical protein [bacterium]